MKMLILVLGITVSSLTFGGDEVMEKCGNSMDQLEGNLRILLNKPASGVFPKEMLTAKEKVEASKRLLRVEMKYPGCLNGAVGKSSWKQYNIVRSLYDELMGDEKLDEDELQKIANRIKRDDKLQTDCATGVNNDQRENSKLDLKVKESVDKQKGASSSQ